MKLSKVTTASLFAASLLGAGQAKAALFNYQFDNVDGPVSGTVLGSITLPDGDGTFGATLVTIDAYPAALGLGPTPISLGAISPLSNTFTVSGGQILSSDYFGLINSNTSLSLSNSSFAFCPSGSTFLDLFDAVDCGVSGVLDSSSTTLSFSPAAASVPGPLPLLGAAAAFAHSRRLRARLRHGSRPKA